jgi:hypothetical protein
MRTVLKENCQITYRCVHAIPYYRNDNTIGDSMVLHGHIDMFHTKLLNFLWKKLKKQIFCERIRQKFRITLK